VNRYLRTGEGVIGLGERVAKDWTPQKVREIGNFLAAQSAPDEEVLSWWPGFLVDAQRRSFPRFENHFAIPASRSLSKEEQERYQVASLPYLLETIKAKRFRTGAFGGYLFNRKIRNALREAEYREIQRFGGTVIFQAASSPSQDPSGSREEE
jgi:hypothetical protein